MSRVITDITRWILTLVVLYFVYRNAHWSVTLALFLIFVRAEVVDFMQMLDE